ncbi:hypothetical protein K737_300437 [Holospora undulata HU1]|uniref:Uncharacterized protein n=1 Tax=Holospora undulata HU1 TaxID=1321371 RepID=A0A061JIT7_9PROT|nr:hypothetical protein K737_300437 [Holospora undulata HU1]
MQRFTLLRDARYLMKAGVKYPSLKGACPDAGSRKSYRKTFEEFVQNMLKKTVEILARIAKSV